MLASERFHLFAALTISLTLQGLLYLLCLQTLAN